MLLHLLNLIGSAGVLFLLYYMIVDLFDRKKIGLSDIVGHVIVIVLLYSILIRT